NDGTARLWNAADGRPLAQPLKHEGPVWAVAFSPDGRTILTRSNDRTVRLWHAADGTPIGRPLAFPEGLAAAAVSPERRTIRAVSGEDVAVRRWTVPLPMPGDPRRIELWAQVITGLELNELGAIQFLDAQTWQERRRDLQELGGPPIP